MLWLWNKKWLKPLQMEIHSDGCLHFDGRTIEDVGGIAPFLHCAQGRWDKLFRTGDGLQFGDPALFVDKGVQQNRALNAFPLGFLRIDRRDLVDKVSLRDFSGKPDSIMNVARCAGRIAAVCSARVSRLGIGRRVSRRAN